MNKTELVEKIAVGAELSKADAKKALEAAVEAIKTALVEGDKVQLIGFGTFSVNERPAREGMNLRTREKIQIAAKKVAKFKQVPSFQTLSTKPNQSKTNIFVKPNEQNRACSSYAMARKRRMKSNIKRQLRLISAVFLLL